MINMLTDPVIRCDASDGSRVGASLPDVYAELMSDAIDAFPALRPHQRHAWHAFLVQLGAMAMHRAGASEPPGDADGWAGIIRGLTPEDAGEECWQLVVDDITKPAFLQPPAGSADREPNYKHEVRTPDELDMLVTARNHDLKSAVAGRASTDDWVFALITLQTMEGFGGAGNYGISRMNRGLGNRPAFTLAPLGGPGAHVRRDILALLERRPVLLTEYPMQETGHALLWTIPWDGTREEALLLDRLDPLYVEVCRRVRLHSGADGTLSSVRAVSKAPRIEARDLNGRTGDPWTPVNQKAGKSLTLAAGGFTYRRITEYLTSPDWDRPALLQPTPSEQRSEGTMRLVARAMVRGQGKTEGYHERIIPLRHRTVRALGRVGGAGDIGEIASNRIEQIRIVQRILSHAIQVFVAHGDPEQINPEDRALARPWLNRLDDIVDAHFFDALQAELEAGEGEREGLRNDWLQEVQGSAEDLLHDAENALPCPAIHRYRARAGADGLFAARMRGPKGLPFLFAEATGEANDDDHTWD